MRSIRLALVLALSWLGAPERTAHGAAVTNQTGFIINTWEAKDGLPQSSVISMVQTRDGYLWLGTLNGLVRFDGVRFTVFDEANTPGLNSSRIVYLFEDSRTNLWIGTETAGIALARDGKVITVDAGHGSREGRLVSACEDTRGAIWLYTQDGQLFRYGDGVKNIWSNDTASRCRVVTQEKNGPVWVGTDAGQFPVATNAGLQPSVPLSDRFFRAELRLDHLLASRAGGLWRLADGRVHKWTDTGIAQDLGDYPWGLSTLVSCACEDQQGNLVVGTLGSGIFWYRADGTCRQVSTADGLSHDIILSLCLDQEGSLWVGTDGGGLNRVRRNAFASLPEAGKRVTQTVCEDSHGGIWAGFNNGGAIHVTNGLVQEYSLPNANNVWSILVDRHEQVWAGSWGGGLFRFENGQFQAVEGPEAIRGAVLALHEDRRGRLWLGTQNGLVCRDVDGWKTYNHSHGLAADAVRALADDADGNLWVGTVGGGLSHWRDGTFETFRKSAEGLPGDDVSSLAVDKDGVLWIGTFGSGLARLEKNKWTRFTTREGLASNGIGYLVEDAEGNLWIGSNAGLMRIPKRELNAFAAGTTNALHCRTYTEADGLPTRECTQGSQPGAIRARDGRLWFPTTRGLASLAPETLTPNTNPPPVLIESVLVDGQAQARNGLRMPLSRTVNIPPHRERLEIQYTSLNLAAPDRAHFRYRMAGHETDWVEAGSSRLARYSKLPPGEYRFEVTAGNEDGYWNATGDSLAIIVEPPFWRTVWFAGLMGILLVGSIVTTVYLVSTQKLQRRLKQQEALEKDRSRIARDLHDQLGASLTQVALLGEMVESDKDQPGEVETHGQQIAQTARDTTHVLDEIVWAVNPQNDTLDSLITYVCKYAQDYLAVADIRYRLDAPAQLPPLPLKPEIRHNVFLAAKEAITNVVKHAGAKSVWLRLRLEPARFSLEIEDDGRGAPDTGKPSSRNGLRNMRKRMEDVGGEFTIGPAAERGTVVRLTAPIGKP